MATTWRDFEKLVARIEETLAPKGAIVKSPDHVRDLITNKLREVDASIRFDVGSTPILITIECRKRSGIQDVTWIEQLATKRQQIGAAKTIAVSATGFSASAAKTARLHGIELRTLEDRIGEEIVQRFLSGFKISLLVTDFGVRTIAFELEDGTLLPPDRLGDDLLAVIKSDGLGAVVARETGTGFAITIDSIMRRVDDRAVPVGGPPVVMQVSVAFQPATVQVSTKNGPQFIRRIEIVADFARRLVPVPAIGLYEYATPDKLLRHTIEAVGRISESDGVHVLVDISSPSLESSVTVSKQKGREPRKKK